MAEAKIELVVAPIKPAVDANHAFLVPTFLAACSMAKSAPVTRPAASGTGAGQGNRESGVGLHRVHLGT